MAQDSLMGTRDQLAARPVRPIHIPITTADGEVLTRGCLLVGWSFRETTGSAAARVELEGAQSTAGPVVGESAIASNGTDTQIVSDEGVYCEGGIFLHVVSGSVTGCVYARF